MCSLQRLALTPIVLMGLLSPSTVHASPAQETRGHVIVPMSEEGCDGYVGAVLETGVRAFVGFRFGVSDSTWTTPFVLGPDIPASDIDIAFRQGPGTSWQQRFKTRAPGGETGVVPLGARAALVCLYFGSPTRFTYRAG